VSLTRSNQLSRIVIVLLLLIVITLFLLPVLFMLASSFKHEEHVLTQAGSLRALWPETASLQNYRDVLARVPFLSYLLNSVWINGLIVGCGLVVNALAGYALARLRWRGREQVLTLVLALLIIPFEALAVPLFYQLSALGLRDTYTVQVLPFIANPLAIYLFYSFFIGLPRELEEAARLDGAGFLRTFVSIVLPNARPALATVAIVMFLFHWGMYLWPLLMTAGEDVRPLPLAVATFYSLPPRQWGDILAFGVMMVLPVLVLFTVFQRWFVHGIATSGLKG
jgi:multiple sugar transport system permease protein